MMRPSIDQAPTTSIRKMRIIYVIIVLLLATRADSKRPSSGSASGSPNCLDEDGKPVDWYIIYKIPQLPQTQAPFDTGYAYAYITSDDVGLMTSNGGSSKNKDDSKLKWTISSRLLSDPDSMVQKTLGIAYDKTAKYGNGLNSILYNDAPPNSPDGEKGTASHNRGHSKGVIMIDDQSGDGVWLTHSTPQYPPKFNDNLYFGPSSKKNGQTFMCINFDARKFGSQIVDHLITIYPQIYESKISRKLQAMIPNLENLTLENEKKKVRIPMAKRAQVISTRAGQELYIYSKSSKFGEDLYTGWISREIQSSLYVGSWRIASGIFLDSSCPRNQYHVNNVQGMHLGDDRFKVNWSYTKDHSKWAISGEIDPGVVCITDINRTESQFSRGGGAVCMKSPVVWSVFSKTIEDIQPCPKGKGLSNP